MINEACHLISINSIILVSEKVRLLRNYIFFLKKRIRLCNSRKIWILWNLLKIFYWHHDLHTLASLSDRKRRHMGLHMKMSAKILAFIWKQNRLLLMETFSHFYHCSLVYEKMKVDDPCNDMKGLLTLHTPEFLLNILMASYNKVVDKQINMKVYQLKKNNLQSWKSHEPYLSDEQEEVLGNYGDIKQPEDNVGKLLSARWKKKKKKVTVDLLNIPFQNGLFPEHISKFLITFSTNMFSLEKIQMGFNDRNWVEVIKAKLMQYFVVPSIAVGYSGSELEKITKNLDLSLIFESVSRNMDMEEVGIGKSSVDEDEFKLSCVNSLSEKLIDLAIEELQQEHLMKTQNLTFADLELAEVVREQFPQYFLFLSGLFNNKDDEDSYDKIGNMLFLEKLEGFHDSLMLAMGHPLDLTLKFKWHQLKTVSYSIIFNRNCLLLLFFFVRSPFS